jgi:hypothetical protein
MCQAVSLLTRDLRCHCGLVLPPLPGRQVVMLRCCSTRSLCPSSVSSRRHAAASQTPFPICLVPGWPFHDLGNRLYVHYLALSLAPFDLLVLF